MIRTLTTAAALAATLAVASCAAPHSEPPELIPPAYAVKVANTPAGIAWCQARGGTPTRDPQPPRPTSDPGPTFICRIVP